MSLSPILPATALEPGHVEQLPIRQAEDVESVLRCYPLFEELRPHLSEERFLERWREQSNEGYRIVFIEIDQIVVAAAGFRAITTMAWGRILYLDDLITHPGYRGKGFGTYLIRHLQDVTRQLGCAELHLDTGYNRRAAHRSYLRNGFDLVCHHLSWSSRSEE